MEIFSPRPGEKERLASENKHLLDSNVSLHRKLKAQESKQLAQQLQLEETRDKLAKIRSSHDTV